MKNAIIPLILVGLSQLALTQASATYIVNGDFEDGLNGWTRHASGGHTASISDAYPYLHPYPFGHPLLDPAVYTLPDYVPLPTLLPPFIDTAPSTLNASSGDMLQISLYQGGLTQFDAPDGSRWEYFNEDHETGLHQTLNLMTGQIVSGWARFITGDYFYEEFDNDNATVRINGEEIWEKSPADVIPGNITITPPFNEIRVVPAPWEQWSWTAPANGSYTLSLSTYGDDQDMSYGYFDNITVSDPTRVDDAFSTIALLSSGMGLLLFLKRSIKRKKHGLPA